MVSTIVEAITKGGTVIIAGFGTFTACPRAARQGWDPATGETIAIPASKAPAFKPGKKLRGTVKAG